MGVVAPMPGSGPTQAETEVESSLAALDLGRRIGQLMVSHVYGPGAGSVDERNLHRYGVATPAEVVTKFGLGGVIYFRWSDNIRSAEQIAGLSQGLRAAAAELDPGVDLDISTDQETGWPSRLRRAEVTEFPGAMAAAATGSTDLVRSVFATTGAELRSLGISTDFAPSADVNVNPANPIIGTRSFGSDPARVAAFVTAAIAGLQDDAGISAAAKHFPGHGDTAADSHHTLPVITHSRAQWHQLDRPPFAAAIAAGVDLIMTAHLAFPELDPSGDPATLSRPILTGLLREDLGYDGLVITDSLQMSGVRERYGDGEVAVRALEAGVDLLLMPADPAAACDALRHAVRTGRLSEERIETSVRRVLAWKAARARRGSRDPATDSGLVGTAERIELADRVAEQSVTWSGASAQLPSSGEVWVVGPDAPSEALARRLEKRGRWQVRHDGTDEDAGGEESEAVLGRLTPGSTVVMVTDNAWRHAGQRRLLEALGALASAGRFELIMVAVGDPYDLGLVEPAVPALASFSSAEVAMSAVARVLSGERTARGRLPVEIPDGHEQVSRSSVATETEESA